MENATVPLFDLRSPTWEVIHFYHPYCVGGLFALTALLSLVYAGYLFYYRAYNHMGGLLSVIFLLSFLFSTARALLLVQDFYPDLKPVLVLIDCIRIPSICSLFGLMFVAVVRSSESEFNRASLLARLTCLICLLVNYGIAATPTVLKHFYTSKHIITQAAVAGAEMYFMVVLFIMGLAYIFMLPKTIAMGRNVKSSSAVPRRLIAAALVGFMAAFLLLGYVLFLLAGFLSVNALFGDTVKGEMEGLLQQLSIIGTSGTEALVISLLVITAVLLINTPTSALRTPDISHHTSGPEMQGLLYPGRTAAISPAYRGGAGQQAGSNGFHSLYKTDA